MEYTQIPALVAALKSWPEIFDGPEGSFTYDSNKAKIVLHHLLTMFDVQYGPRLDDTVNYLHELSEFALDDCDGRDYIELGETWDGNDSYDTASVAAYYLIHRLYRDEVRIVRWRAEWAQQ